MPADTEISRMLAECEADDWLRPFARDLLNQYADFAFSLRRHTGTREEKQAVADDAQATLRRELKKLIDARDAATAVTPSPTSPATDTAQQTTPGE